ncbi:hypothetical protein LTR35_012933 [Friedmanniomyces endolithicus]|uniref:Uncharacterized protein n=1 Tax=Friedmanniomyces endolithicus TaxID=329885 RepID=A0AAN6FKK2_9PEZI|nr:hypothetical protein LTR35_012933 [Friedmanniomyces endolithicus]KAK0285492.1 hypothetical protein LTS00_010853 [Friedmanniomyces endolithicus]KAK0319164.1 hypothetical protein LTR82_009928 [Friedmanniomyces endolithicus]KAK0986961.1 hypothetical protein LTR54_013345 [Friedmanniomyces endolithicus]
MPAKTPKASKAKVEAAPEPKPETPKKSNPTPKKPKAPIVYNTLDKVVGSPIPIEVVYEGQSDQAKLAKAGIYGHTIKLEAPSAFSLFKTLVIAEGEYEGYQAILLRPAKAFPFLKLSKEVRQRTYGFYFAQKGVVDEAIVIDGKRANKEVFAKTFAEGSKHRVGLLAVNKEIHEEAIQAFYGHTLRLESTSTLLDFLSQIPASVRPRLKSLSIKTYIKTTSRNAMHFLADSRNLTKLRIDTNIFSEGDPAKAAKAFYADAYRFLENIGAAKGDKVAGVDVLEFGKQALQYKDDKKNAKPWSSVMVEEFKELLRNKLK